MDSEHLPHYLLFECASGYALFDAPELTHVGMSTIKSVEDYINRSDQPFKLKASFLFSSDNEALDQMKAISKSTVAEQLQKFLLDCLPQPSTGGSRYCIATCDAALGSAISRKTGLASRSATLINYMQPGVLEKAQRNLSHLYYNIKSPVVVSSSSSHSLKQQVGVVPHRFEGVFNVKGKEDMFCTKNLVPGEALYGEELIGGQNEEDRTEVEYRVWDPLESKLGAAILFGVANIWIKPGSRVLYIGNVCGLTISNLSDLVGSDGFVYVVAFSADVVDMAGKRPNVVTIFEFFFIMVITACLLVWWIWIFWRRILWSVMLVSILDLVGIIWSPHGQKTSIQLVTLKIFFADRNRPNEFKPIETVMLDLTDGAYAVAVGGYRMLEE
ncbi:hypothetical protein OROGR_002375 [Orobanche gracilis]